MNDNENNGDIRAMDIGTACLIILLAVSTLTVAWSVVFEILVYAMVEFGIMKDPSIWASVGLGFLGGLASMFRLIKSGNSGT